MLLRTRSSTHETRLVGDDDDISPRLAFPIHQVIVVSDEFEGKPLVARHRMVNALFMEEMTGNVPAMHGEGKRDLAGTRQQVALLLRIPIV